MSNPRKSGLLCLQREAMLSWMWNSTALLQGTALSMRPSLPDCKRWGRASALMCSPGKDQGIAGYVCCVCPGISWMNGATREAPWALVFKYETDAQEESVWQLSWCQETARLLVPLPLPWVYWAVALVPVFPKGYGPALQNILLLKHHRECTDICVVNEMTCQEGCRGLLTLALSPSLPKCFYLWGNCRALASSCTQDGDWRNDIKRSQLITQCPVTSALCRDWYIPPLEWNVAVGWCCTAMLNAIFGQAMKDPAVSTHSNGLGDRTEMPWWNLPLLLTLAWHVRAPHHQTFVLPYPEYKAVFHWHGWLFSFCLDSVAELKQAFQR